MIYLDHHAAAPLSDEARTAMTAARSEPFGNPSSVHGAGRRARAALEEARAAVAESVSCAPAEVLFTSGGTEACNLGVLGLAGARPGRLVTTSIEHPAVEASLTALRTLGFEVISLDVAGGAPPTAEALAAAIDDDTRLVAVQWINHETGNVLPVASYARAARDRGVPIFVDGIQALGKVEISFAALGATALAIASHKAGGPAGAGALVLTRGAFVAPRMLGGAQERGLRAGTPDVVAMVGFGAACRSLGARVVDMPRIGALRDRLEAFCVERGGRVNGAAGERVPTVTNVSFAGWRGTTLVAALDVEGLAVASGAACSSGVDRPSAVLRGMYPGDPERASSAIRMSLGPETTSDEIDRAIAILDRVLARPPA